MEVKLCSDCGHLPFACHDKWGCKCGCKLNQYGLPIKTTQNIQIELNNSPIAPPHVETNKRRASIWIPRITLDINLILIVIATAGLGVLPNVATIKADTLLQIMWAIILLGILGVFLNRMHMVAEDRRFEQWKKDIERRLEEGGIP